MMDKNILEGIKSKRSRKIAIDKLNMEELKDEIDSLDLWYDVHEQILDKLETVKGKIEELVDYLGIFIEVGYEGNTKGIRRITK